MNFDIASRGSAPTDYLEAAARILSSVKLRSYQLLHAAPGDCVLDVGCGPGLDTVQIASTVGPEGLVVGVDQDWQTIKGAHARALTTAPLLNVFHQAGDAHRLPFRTAQFDAARCDRMLMHLKMPGPVVIEIARVLKAGGWLVLTEPDWGTLSISSTLTSIERRLAEIRADHTLANGYAGRTLYQLLHELGFEAITVEVAAVWSPQLAQIRYLTFLDRVENQAVELGFLSEHELALWRDDLETLDRAGHCFATMNLITAAGRKPPQ